jgi:hypothetical protein
MGNSDVEYDAELWCDLSGLSFIPIATGEEWRENLLRNRHYLSEASWTQAVHFFYPEEMELFQDFSEHRSGPCRGFFIWGAFLWLLSFRQSKKVTKAYELELVKNHEI